MKKTPVDTKADGELPKEEMISSLVANYVHLMIDKPSQTKLDNWLKDGLTDFDTTETTNALKKCIKKLKERISN